MTENIINFFDAIKQDLVSINYRINWSKFYTSFLVKSRFLLESNYITENYIVMDADNELFVYSVFHIPQDYIDLFMEKTQRISLERFKIYEPDDSPDISFEYLFDQKEPDQKLIENIWVHKYLFQEGIPNIKFDLNNYSELEKDKLDLTDALNIYNTINKNDIIIYLNNYHESYKDFIEKKLIKLIIDYPNFDHIFLEISDESINYLNMAANLPIPFIRIYFAYEINKLFLEVRTTGRFYTLLDLIEDFYNLKFYINLKRQIFSNPNNIINSQTKEQNKFFLKKKSIF
ncbi:MAG: hypothetical protein ACTSQO_06380 [Candidatus Helarchaeota archaeon]